MTESTSELKQILVQQAKLIEILAEQFSVAKLTPSAPIESKQSVDAIANSITEFHYEPENTITFDSWFQRFEDLFTYDLSKQEDQWKVRLLLRKLGTKEHEKYVQLILPKQPKDLDFKTTVEKLRSIFGEQSTLFSIRYNCLKLTRSDADDMVSYAALINKECERFKLKSLSEDQFKCLLFISGLQSSSDAETRIRLLNKLDQDPETTLDALLTECKRLQSIKHDSSLIQSSGSSIHAIQTRPARFGSRDNSSGSRPAGLGPRGQLGARSAGLGPHQGLGSRSAGLGSRGQPGFHKVGLGPHNSGSRSKKSPSSSCWLCGAWHYVRLCPFKRHRCRDCNNVGHSEGFCNSAHKNRSQLRSLMASVSINSARLRKFVTINVNGHPCRLQLDTASDITVISYSMWRSIGKPALERTTHTATSACGGTLQLRGRLQCCVSFRDKTVPGSCYVADTDLNLLGLDWLDLLGLADLPIRAICNTLRADECHTSKSAAIFKEFAPLFEEGLGRCTTTQADLCLVPGSAPVFRPKRPVPYAALSQVDAEITRLLDLGVLTPVSYSKWAAPIVAVKKANGSVRLCADFSTGLNAALKTHCYPLPLPCDLFTILNGGAFFAKFDLADAYLQIEVAPESRELLTINTHRGLFQYTRLPFGVKTAPAIFQQIMDTVISGTPGVGVYLDDIVIVGRTEEELKNRIHIVLERIQDAGFLLRPEKCQMFLRSIKYLGFIFDENGRRPDPENIRAIQQMPAPTDLNSLRSFLGLISYYSAFVPSMHNLRAPLNRLLQKDVKWQWTSECENAFARMKSMLSSDLLLTHFDPTLPITVAADASNHGIGAVLLHTFPDNTQKAVMHVSRTLTAAEKKYGQIEKEALGLIFAVKKFHKFIYGRRFTLLTDHKPLLSIFGTKKGIPTHSANRLQRWATILLGYDFNIQYRRTHAFGQADALSRLISNSTRDDDDTVIASVTLENEVDQTLRDVVRGLPVTAEDIQHATARDPVLRRVTSYVQSGWPGQKFSGELQQFFQRRTSLAVINACVVFASRVVVPVTLRPTVLRQFHVGHPGTSRMKAIARGHAYWPGMDQEIEDLVKRCSKCQQAAKLPARQPPIPWPEPERAWSRLHLDFAGPINGMSYLIVVDAYSKWPEIFPLKSPTSSSTIQTLRRLFSQHGFPELLVTDNGSQFTSAEFSAFCKASTVEHIRSPPYHPQSNGQAERFVDTFKRALAKSKGEGTEDEILQRFLLLYRSTPAPNVPKGQSPAEALMGRKLRTTLTAMLPSHPRQHGPNNTSNFGTGTKVYARDYRPGHQAWADAIITGRRGRVLFEVKAGRDTWIRHRNQLRHRMVQTEVTDDPQSLPLDILLDTFNMETKSQEINTTEGAKRHRLQRRSSRIPKPTVRIQVDPRRSVY